MFPRWLKGSSSDTHILEAIWVTSLCTFTSVWGREATSLDLGSINCLQVPGNLKEEDCLLQFYLKRLWSFRAACQIEIQQTYLFSLVWRSWDRKYYAWTVSACHKAVKSIKKNSLKKKIRKGLSPKFCWCCFVLLPTPLRYSLLLKQLSDFLLVLFSFFFVMILSKVF